MGRYLTFILISFITSSLYAQQTNFDWAIQCGNPPNTTDTKTCLASGVYGTFAMAGEFLDEAVFGSEVLTSSGGTDVFVVRYDGQGEVLSAFKIGSADYDFVQDIDMDGLNNIYVLGFFYGTIQLGADQYTSFGSQDIFLAKMDDLGNVLWSQQVGGLMADYPVAISLLEDGSVTMAGYFYDQIILGDTSLVSQAGSDIYLARFDPDGQLTGVMQAGGSSSDQLHSLTVDNQGRYILSGSFYTDITIGDTTLSTTDPVGVFVASIETDLSLGWAFQLNGTYLNTESYAMADHEGNFYLGGSFSEDIFFGAQVFSAGEFNQDVYLAKYSGTGQLQWARHGWGLASDQVTGLGVDENNNVYMTGHFLDTLHFEEVTIPYTLCCGSREVYIINYSHDGRPWWSDQFSGTRTALHSMTMGTGSQVIMSGQFTEEVTLGPWTLSSFEGFVNYVTCLSGDIFTTIPQSVNNTDIQVYPNPVKDILYLNSEMKIKKAEVFNIAGVTLLTGEDMEMRTVDVSQLSPGAYFLRITVEKGDTEVFKIVKMD